MVEGKVVLVLFGGRVWGREVENGNIRSRVRKIRGSKIEFFLFDLRC